MTRPATPEVMPKSPLELLLESFQQKVVAGLPAGLFQLFSQHETGDHAIDNSFAANRVDHRCRITDKDGTVMSHGRHLCRMRQVMAEPRLQLPHLDAPILQLLDVRVQE